MTQDVGTLAHPMIHVMPTRAARKVETTITTMTTTGRQRRKHRPRSPPPPPRRPAGARMIVTVREYYLQIQIPLKAGKFGGAKVGGQDLLGEELAVRDGEGTAGRAPCDERIAIANCGGWRCCGEEERWLCGTASAGDDGVLLLLLSWRFHLEHLVEAAGELLGNPSLPRFREGNGGGEGGGGHRPGLHWRCPSYQVM